jgi:hypothetical protein
MSPDPDFPLIRGQGGAIVALASTALLTTLAVRDLLVPSKRPSGGLLPLDFLLPHSLTLAANVAFYLYLVWMGISLVRGCRAKERLVVGGWFTRILLGPLKMFVPSPAVLPIQIVKATGMLVALVAAVLIFLEILRGTKAEHV